MKIAVITAYYRPNRDWLEKCHQSVLKQTYPCTHILIGDGYPVDYVDDWNIQHITLSHNHNDFGDSPRAIASAYAIGQGFDAIAYVDDDNWYHPLHIETLVKLHKLTQAPICASNRLFTRLDGSPLGICPISHPKSFIDTNCYLFTKPAFDVTTSWSRVPLQYHSIGDRLVLLYIKKHRFKIAFSNGITVAYRTQHPGDYAYFGEKRTIPKSEIPKYKRIGKARISFQKLTGINLSLKPVRPVYKYHNGNFWDGSI